MKGWPYGNHMWMNVTLGLNNSKICACISKYCQPGEDKKLNLAFLDTIDQKCEHWQSHDKCEMAYQYLKVHI